MQETAWAKINLALHVRCRRADGYHEIETAFAFVADGDRLTVEAGDTISLDISGPFAGDLHAGPDNLVLRAAGALAERAGVDKGARIHLEKRLPIASGLGGGSADAAATLRLLSRYWRLDADEETLVSIASSLGADVPACVLSRPAYASGRGDVMAPLADPPRPGTPLLLVNPGRPLSTAAVFRAWNGPDGGPLRDWREGRNDLEEAATMMVPEIAAVTQSLSGARFARMSGSGATCFGLFDDPKKRDRVAETIAARGWWTLASVLL